MHRFFVLALGFCALILTACDQSPTTTAEDAAPGVSAFYSGLAALEMGFFDRARADLDRAAQRFPDEPAVWANLGVLAMRLGDGAGARTHLERARALAPTHADIAMLLGALESREGNPEAAIEQFREAVALAPAALKPRYALASELERQGGEAVGNEVRGLVQRLIADDPGNPVLRLEHVRLAARADDTAALATALEGLEALATHWPPPAQAQFNVLREAAADPKNAAIEVAFLRNVLLRDPAFQQGMDRIQVPAQVGGEPLTGFIDTPLPPATPAAADTALAYAASAAGADQGRADTVLATVLTADGPLVAVPAGADGVYPRPGERLPVPTGPLNANQALAVDWDNDGAIDVVIATAGGMIIYRQDDAGTMHDVSADTGLDAGLMSAAYHGAWAADLELDGDLDLVLAADSGPPLVLQNNGDGTFIARPLFETVDGLRAFVWADLDGDGIPDAAALDAAGRLHALRNTLAWSYAPMMPPEGDYLAIAVAGLMEDGGLTLVALARDGRLLTGLPGNTVPTATWADMPAALPVGQARVFAADLDNNGAVDLLASAAGRSAIWLAEAEGAMQPLSAAPAGDITAIADLSGDGRLDLLGVDAKGRATQWQASGERDYGWQTLRPRALTQAGDNRINTFGLGGRIEVRTGQRVQRQAIDAPVIHIGLGEQSATDVAWILWPNGTSQAEFDLPAAGTAVAVQRLKGSCPWVFAYDGEGMRFVTDFLWRSPLGMRINAVDTATITQTEDWVRIPADALAAVEGQYELRITAELWETHFVDAVSLLAIDHPVGTEMVVDERFARAAPALAPIITGPARPVASVVDDRGRDWTAVAAELDERYIGGLDLGRYQGITRPHHIEIDLGDVGDDESLVLLASGWIYPTDSSINVAISQGAEVRPQGLRLEAQNADGDWVVVRPDLGFPAGKHKTIVIDLVDVFDPGVPRRLRLHTNLEIYWDRIAVARREDTAPTVTSVLTTEVAALRYRGFSHTRQPSREMPEVPQYDRLQGASQRWSDLEGYHTRYGDVRELLDAPDDRYVIMNAGDELVLRFAAAPPADGVQRSFVLVGHGWVKDGDYNTAFARTVLPLPSRGQPVYDTPPTTLEDDPVYRRHAEDWRRFHTRYVRPTRFLDGLRSAGAP